MSSCSTAAGRGTLGAMPEAPSHLTNQEKRALLELKQRLQQKFPGRFKSVQVFGSKARGEVLRAEFWSHF